jgi:predicted helicase
METLGLENVKTFEQLLPWLADNLDWPVHDYDFEDVSFDWDPFADLGIKAEDAAHLRELKQLRPLVTNQPWGIFFVSFEGKKIPLGVLKRILGAFTLKKRASANSAEKKTWNLHDLIFISAQGNTGERELSFLHFNEEKDNGNKIILKELGWDQQDTQTKLAYVAGRLKGNLVWPEDGTKTDYWRQQWSSAFSSKHGAAISTTKDLTKRLADLAGKIRVSVNEVLDYESANGSMIKIFNDFRQIFFHNLDHDGFADMYAQTICYGLLAARIMRSNDALVADDAALIAPLTQPFLKDLMETFLAVGGKKDKIDFNALGIEEVVTALQEANMEAVLVDFGNKNPDEDPIIHFYEHFLNEYDAAMQKGRGVYYTPQPVVRFIVRSVDEILEKEFGLVDGLADTATWSEMSDRNPEIKIPEHAAPNDPFVQILDPATGTGTFLVEVIDLIHKRLTKKWGSSGKDDLEIRGLWNSYVPTNLLTRINGFELMMAPYAIAHIKIAMKLAETGYDPSNASAGRVKLYLSDTLEEARYSELTQGKTIDMFAQIGTLEEEAKAAGLLKTKTPITVVIGNPPYSSVSGNKTNWIRDLVNHYLFIDGKRIEEKSKRNHLQNDYIKFIRIADYFCSRSSASVLGFITSNSYLDGRTLRGLRWHLMQRFSQLKILNLYGDSNKSNAATDDQNVFQITEGVSILLASRSVTNKKAVVHYNELQGTKKYKYQQLESPENIFWPEITVRGPYYTFSNLDTEREDEYMALGPTLDKVFNNTGAGMKSNRDAFATDVNPNTLLNRIKEFGDRSISDDDIRARYSLKDNYTWKLPKIRKSFFSNTVSLTKIVPLSYRPFDNRYVYYDKHIVFNPRIKVMRHLLDGRNLAIVTIGQNESRTFNHAFVSRFPPEIKFATHYGASVVCPLYSNTNLEDDVFAENISREPNFGDAAEPLMDLANGYVEPEENSEIAVFHYIYSILYSPIYRTRYSEQFLTEFPRIPKPLEIGLFKSLVNLGSQLTSLHLMDLENVPQLFRPVTRFVGTGDARVAKSFPKYENGKVMINDQCHFEEVTPDVWEFHVGGYQVCRKWLKDRAGKGGKNPHPGRVLSDEDIMHYRRITVAIKETIRLMAEVDKTLNKHGGWPDAFYVAPPPPPTIEELIALEEGQEVEFKSTFQFCLKQGKKDRALQKASLKTIAAFLNSGGGTLAIGITNELEIHGLEDDFSLLSKDDKQEWFRQTVVNAINNGIGELFAPCYECRYAETENGKLVFVVEIKERGPRPAFVNHLKENDDEFFVRTDLKTVKLIGDKKMEHIGIHWGK